MCRLTAYLGAPIPASTLLFGGSHPLYRQAWAPREMLSGSVNADGWGVTWWEGGRPARLARPEPVWHDPDLERVLERIELRCGLAALRNTTPGLPVDSVSVPPLVHDRWSFVLNGYVPAFRARHMRDLRRALPDDLYGSLRGSSDTETLFLLVVDALRQGASLAEALHAVARRLLERVERAGGGECQLTMLVSDGDALAVTSTSNVEASNSLYWLEGASPAPEGVLLASEALDADGAWRRLPSHRTLVVGAEGTSVTPAPS